MDEPPAAAHMVYHREGKPDRRQELILAAYNLIAQKGFEGLRVRAVALQVGINGATLHHYFPTKEDLIQAVVDYVVAHLSAAEAGPDLHASPPELLHYQLKHLAQLMQNEPKLFVVLVEINLRQQRNPAANFLARREKDWHIHLANLLQTGIDQKYWAQNLDPIATASVIIALVEGAGQWAMTDPGRGEQVLVQFEKWLLAPP